MAVLTYKEVKKFAGDARSNKRKALAEILTPLKDLLESMKEPSGNASQSEGTTTQVTPQDTPQVDAPALGADGQSVTPPPPPENTILAKIKKLAIFAKERHERLPDPPEVAMEKLDKALDRCMLFMKQSKAHVGEKPQSDLDVKIGDTVLDAAITKPRGGGVGN